MSFWNLVVERSTWGRGGRRSRGSRSISRSKSRVWKRNRSKKFRSGSKRGRSKRRMTKRWRGSYRP